MPRPLRRNRGFTYLGLIILVAIIGLVGAAGLKLGSLLQRSAAEQELLDIGAAFSDALKSYASVTPPGQPQQPASLKDLLKDPRFPGIRRHLRKLFVDPITGKADWGLMYMAGNTGIVGVYSLSDAKPVKVGNFDARFANFDDKAHLSDWKFTVADSGVPQVQGQNLPIAPPSPPQPLAPPSAPPQQPQQPQQPQPAQLRPEPEPQQPSNDALQSPE
ncbi:type II secretory pathway pseudopilin PulG [Oxalobacteraceae bacterium GrIS 1.11]